MDFRRIENILIIAFLMLNIFLGFSFFNDNRDLISTMTASRNISVTNKMQNDNIAIDSMDETVYPKAPFMRTLNQNDLQQQTTNLPNQVVAVVTNGNILSRFNIPIALGVAAIEGRSSFTVIDELLQGDQILFGKEYTYSYYDNYRRVVTYVQMLDGIPLLDGSAEINFHIDEHLNVISYTQSHKFDPKVQGEPRNLITASSAIETLYLNNEIPPNTRIKSVTLAYVNTLVLSELTVYGPAWVAAIDNGEQITLKRVDALNNSIIANTQPQVSNTLTSIQSQAVISNQSSSEQQATSKSSEPSQSVSN